MTAAQDQLRSLIARILRLKEEQDALSADIREVYKEAHSAGFNKTVMGLAVARIRKEGKDGLGRVAEADQLLEIYLEAYRGEVVTETGTVLARAHTREATAHHDPDTGELTDHAETVTTNPRADGETLEPGSPSTNPIPSEGPAADGDDEGASHLRSAGGEQLSHPPAALLAASMPDMPGFLDRRARA